MSLNLDDPQDRILHLIAMGKLKCFKDGTVIGATGRTIATKVTSSSGYLQIGLCIPGTPNIIVNKQRVVWVAFKGRIPDGYVINHIDGNRENNAIDNLECITQRENTKHASRIGKLAHGRRVQRKVSREELEARIVELEAENAHLRSLLATLPEATA